MSVLTIAAIAAFIFGLATGSFLNVVIYRVPAGQSVVWPGSHCPVCNHSLKAWHNIPLFSFIFLKGRCAFCRTRISWQYPLIELLTGIIFAIVVFKIGLSPTTIVYIIFSSILIALSGIDARTKLLPDAITLPSAIGACLLSLSTLHPVMNGIWTVKPLQSFLGILAGAGPLFLIAWLYTIIRHREGLGGGDIKLMIFVGALLGPGPAVLAIFIGAVVGTLIGVPGVMLKGGGRHVEIPFGPFLSFGAWVAALWGHELIRWYADLSGIPLT